ncbi:MAG: zinc ribbon domain-containing protein [Clostridia bacterium]|nr:zinc ribbon domain-containing protein [Clostridia bacterium]
MFCKYCGHSVKDEAIFCTNCGSRLAVVPVVSETAQQPVRDVTNVKKVNVNNYAVPTYSDAAVGFNIRQAIEKSYVGPMLILIIATLFGVAATSFIALAIDVFALTQRIVTAEVFVQIIRNGLYFAFSLVSALATIKSLAFPLTKNINAFYSQRPFFTARRVVLIVTMATFTVQIVVLFVFLLISGSALSALTGVAAGIGSLTDPNAYTEAANEITTPMWTVFLAIIGIYGAILAAWIVGFTIVSGTYGRIKRYYHMITEAYTDYKYDIRVKPPYLRCFIVGGIIILTGVFFQVFCFSPDIRAKTLSIIYLSTYYEKALTLVAPTILRSMVFQSFALFFMGANLIFNGVIIWKYKIKLHNAFTRYDSSQMTTAR